MLFGSSHSNAILSEHQAKLFETNQISRNFLLQANLEGNSHKHDANDILKAQRHIQKACRRWEARLFLRCHHYLFKAHAHWCFLPGVWSCAKHPVSVRKWTVQANYKQFDIGKVIYVALRDLWKSVCVTMVLLYNSKCDHLLHVIHFSVIFSLHHSFFLPLLQLTSLPSSLSLSENMYGIGLNVRKAGWVVSISLRVGRIL